MVRQYPPRKTNLHRETATPPKDDGEQTAPRIVDSVSGAITFDDGTTQEFTVSYTPEQGLRWDCAVPVAESVTVLNALTAAIRRLRVLERAPLEPVPPAEVLARTPTVADVKRWSEYYVLGPGRAVAGQTHCPHGYYLTDSCPGCDADEEAQRNEKEV